jgi:hypothetical protein
MSFYGFGCMLLIVSGVMYAQFLISSAEVIWMRKQFLKNIMHNHNRDQVHLKEQALGFYGPFLMWAVSSAAYTLLRGGLAALFGYVASVLLRLRTGN